MYKAGRTIINTPLFYEQYRECLFRNLLDIIMLLGAYLD